MSYLIGPRLHFAGTFTADVSTENNYVKHFKNPGDPDDPGWNPSGSGAWSITACKVTSAVFADGTVARSAADDPIVGAALSQIGRARLVDLDPEQQMVSQIWGMRLRLASATGAAAVTGDFKVAPFSDIWPGRLAGPGGGDFAMSAYYQSRITGTAWADLFGSRFLDELKRASDPTSLSIKFNVDGFDQARHVGRIVGTIGPAVAGEPFHFVVGRHCMPLIRGPVWFFPAVVDAQRKKLVADFGNALQTKSFRGPFDDGIDLQVGLMAGGQFTSFGQIPIGPAGWYEQTAGVCEFPAGRSLTDAELTQLAATPIVVMQRKAGNLVPVASEGADGLHVRADDFVFRMSARQSDTAELRVSKFGQPLPNAQIALTLDDSGLQPGSGDPDVDHPPEGVGFPASIQADGRGIAALSLTAGTIDRPRGYIDGQVYGVRYLLPQSDPDAGGYFNPADFISILVWTDYPVPNAPDWNTHVAPILTQYQKLYAVMQNIVDLSSYTSVVEAKTQMKDVFSRPETDPHYMPVTRDLSPAKRNMILQWLDTTGNAGQPNLGQSPLVAMAALQLAAGDVETPHTHDQPAGPGGKTQALRRKPGGTA